MVRTPFGFSLASRPFLLLLFLALLVSAGCRDGLDFRVVEIRLEGDDPDEGWFMSLDTWFLAISPAEADGATWLPTRGESEIFVEVGSAEGFIPLLASDGSHLVFGGGDHIVTLGGVPVFLDLDWADNRGWDWLSRATPEDKKNLRTIGLGDEVTPAQWALLEDLSLHKPRVEVATEDPGLMLRLLDLFDPTFFPLFEEVLLEENFSRLVQEPELRTVTVENPGVSALGALTQIPRLETLLLNEWDPEEAGHLPDEIPGLRSIILTGWDGEDLSALGSQPKLEALILAGCDGDDIPDLTPLASYPDLELLAFRYCDVASLEPLPPLRNLRWLGLNSETTQAELERIVLALPDLEVVELIEAEEVTDISPLADLKNLKGLMLGTTAPPDPLFEMTQLEYLALTVSSNEESPYGEHILPRLQVALPETIITRVDPFCLGSGYILLLFPMVALAWFITRSRKRGKDSGTGHG